MSEPYTTFQVGCDSGSGVIKNRYLSTTVFTPLPWPCGGSHEKVVVVFSSVSYCPIMLKSMGMLGTTKETKKIQIHVQCTVRHTSFIVCAVDPK